MKSIGIVICNYNKCDYVLKCIQSVLESKFQDFDVYVVDNASCDHSVERIRESYGDKVNLLVNSSNVGGSGGFNTGIRKVLESGYEYLMCLDNDVQVDENAVEALYTFLRNHPEVGMVGSKVYHLQAPEYIQQFGLNIDFEHFCAQTLYADTLDSDDIPEIVYCDTVAACSVMLPAKVVKEVGLLPEDNFIYWDDMEWGYKVINAGYKVAAYAKSMVLHQMAANTRLKDTFTFYYMWRNSINFFMKYTPADKAEEMSIRLLSFLFRNIYENIYNKEHEIAKTMIKAYQDALSHIRGKAAEGIIIELPHQKPDFYQLIEGTSSYFLIEKDSRLDKQIQSVNPKIKKKPLPDKAEIRIKKCDDIMKMDDYSLQYIYVDKQLNIVQNKEDIEFIRNYPFSLELFLYMNQEQFLKAEEKIRVV